MTAFSVSDKPRPFAVKLQPFWDCPLCLPPFPRQQIVEPGLRIDVVELDGLCRVPNYAEWPRFPQDSR